MEASALHYDSDARDCGEVIVDDVPESTATIAASENTLCSVGIVRD